jgi:hypothetical protein
MPIANGHGDENKSQILGRYHLCPVMHSVLLNGQSLTCCCGKPITGRFYQFDVFSPFSGRVVNILYAGEDCAEKFFKLSQTLGSKRIAPLALFDLLQADVEAGREPDDARLPEKGTFVAPINAEVEQAIYLTLMSCSAPPSPGRVFSDVLKKIRAHPDRPLTDWEVRAVNTRIGNDGQSLATVLAKLRADNPTLRHFAFPEMTAALRREAAHTGLRIHSCL